VSVKVESRKSIQTEEESSVQFEHNPNVFIRSRKTGNNFFLLQWSKKLICTISNIIALVRREARTCYASSCAGECGSLRVLNNETKALWEIYELQAGGKIGFADTVEAIEANASGPKRRDLRFCARAAH